MHQWPERKQVLASLVKRYFLILVLDSLKPSVFEFLSLIDHDDTLHAQIIVLDQARQGVVKLLLRDQVLMIYIDFEENINNYFVYLFILFNHLHQTVSKFIIRELFVHHLFIIIAFTYLCKN
jgi:hypothetical protein